MAVRLVEGDKQGMPVRVYHRFRQDTWTHSFTDACPICRKCGETVKRRRSVLAAWKRAHRLAEQGA